MGSLVGCLLFVDLRSWSLKSPDRHAFFCVFCNLMSENQLGFCVCSCCFSCYRCCFFGDVSSKRDPQAYLGHVRGLYDNFLGEHYKFYEKQALPLIINTPGWVKGILLFVSFEAFTIVMCLMLELVLLFVFFFCLPGTGYDLLVEMLKYISPTHVVQVRISAESKNLPKGAFWLDGEHYGSLHLIDIYSARTDFFNQS